MDSVYKLSISIMVLCVSWIILVRSMAINHEYGYDDIDHASFALEEDKLGSGTQGAAIGAGVLGAGTLGTVAALCFPH